jgi:hypothetical protein
MLKTRPEPIPRALMVISPAVQRITRIKIRVLLFFIG